jgi:hypothetical protein
VPGPALHTLLLHAAPVDPLRAAGVLIGLGAIVYVLSEVVAALQR